MTHRFHGDRTQTRKGGRYDRRHQLARKAAAARHHPTDPCYRCGQPLGPMGRTLHLDHAEDGTYGGFSHAACNLRAGAQKGNERQREAFGSGQPRTCSVCRAPFEPQTASQRACSDPCREELRARQATRLAAPPLALTDCSECGTTFQPRSIRHCTCGPRCSAQRNRRLIKDWHAARPDYNATWRAARAERAQQATDTTEPWHSRDWTTG